MTCKPAVVITQLNSAQSLATNPNVNGSINENSNEKGKTSEILLPTGFNIHASASRRWRYHRLLRIPVPRADATLF
ncbi:hypothetical protein DMH27_06135 [Raoultella planticola]|nr:hypothetical protein [Raoultella planticola]